MHGFTSANAILLSFLQQSLFFFFFFFFLFIYYTIYHLRKGLLAKIHCNQRYLKGFLSKKRLSFDLVTPKLREGCCSKELLLSLVLLKFNGFIGVYILDICFINTKREWLFKSCLWLTLWLGIIRRETLRAHLNA